MAINTYLSTTESKKQTKQKEKQRQSHCYGKLFNSARWERVYGGMG